MANAFLEKLSAAAERNGSLLCVGLDPDPSLMPVDDVSGFNRAIIDATKDLVCAFKPNFAFYDAMGEPGYRALRETIDHVPSHIPVIGDSKRGDVQPSSSFYAKAMFEQWGVDAATVNAFGGRDAVEPFLEHEDRGVFVWCRSSNPGAGELQDLLMAPAGGGAPGGAQGRPLYEWVAMRAREWNDRGNVGLVVGATYPQELERVRGLCPGMPILLPGVGAQRGDLEQAVSHGVDASGRNAIVAASRSVIYASADPGDFQQAARSKAQEVRSLINDELASRGQGFSPRPGG